jgi:hypothetical protein
MNYTIGVYMYMAERGVGSDGRFGWPGLTRYFIRAIMERYGGQQRRRSFAREVRKPCQIAGKQPGVASGNSEVFWPKPRISALGSDISAVIFGKNSGNSENRRS